MIDDDSDVALDLLALKVRTKLDQLSDFTALHIFVVSLRCEHSCGYCQVSRQGASAADFDMNEDTADRALDFVFRSPSPGIKVNFRAANRFLNFTMVQYIVEGAKRRNITAKRRLEFVIATDLAVIPISLGAEGEAYQPHHEWKATLAYRRLFSNQWFVGTERNDALAPGGSAPIFEIHTGIFDLAYALSDRITVRASVPFSRASLTRTWGDGQQHTQRASGFGDISVQGEAWLLEPRSHERGNVSIGLGLKAPTGSHSKPSQFYQASGPVDFPADQTIQPGDGGFAILTQFLAFRRSPSGRRSMRSGRT